MRESQTWGATVAAQSDVPVSREAKWGRLPHVTIDPMFSLAFTLQSNRRRIEPARFRVGLYAGGTQASPPTLPPGS
jgi:hypothetical protein